MQLASQVSEMKKVGEFGQKMQLINEGLTTIDQRISSDTSDYSRLDAQAKKLKAEVDDVEALLRKGEEVARNRSREIFSKVEARFSEFVRMATNGELNARLC